MGNNSCCHNSAREPQEFILKSSKDPQLSKKISIEDFRLGILGRNTIFDGFFGTVLSLYLDDCSSARPHKLIEEYIASILPIYANTHSDSSYFAVIMNSMYNKSKEYILKYFNAPDEYYALGTGTGMTGAIYHWQEILSNTYPHCFHQSTQEKPIVFVSAYEHHSNILTWQKWGFDIQQIDHTGFEDNWELGLIDLTSKIKKCFKKPLIIISISACSNITSQIAPLEKIAILIKKLKNTESILKSKLLWSIDLAALSSHKQINLSILDPDAIFISPHKITGGPGSCGLLIFKKNNYNFNSSPTKPGGGTVSLVAGLDKKDAIYFNGVDERESGGTPGILQMIRTALTFQLMEGVGCENIIKREEELRDKLWFGIAKINSDWEKSKIKNKIIILGSDRRDNRLTIFSLEIFDEKGELYFYKFMHKLLNDLFGIQLRSGMHCAEPFGFELLHWDQESIKNLKELIKSESAKISEKPGWIRLSLSFSLTDKDLEYILFALKFCSENGRQLEKLYQKKIEEKIREIGKMVKVDLFEGFGVKQVNEEKRNGLMEKRMSWALKLAEKIKNN